MKVMRKYFLILILTGQCLFLSAQYTLQLSTFMLPENHPADENIYLAGTFSNWNPKDEKFKLQKSSTGSYSISVSVKEKTGQYKLTRGSWDKVECDKNGNDIVNRSYDTEVNELVGLTVQGWKDKFTPKAKPSTATKNVTVIDTAFFIPQLKRKRTIRIYLPEGYTASKNRYPVLYMHDAQNLFDNATSFAGEWGVDEFMDSTRLKKCIVVGIDNDGGKRMNEYNTYDNARFGKGEGKEYIDFIVKTLKPYIDKKYRTLRDKNNTSISGSSMGGLISFCAVLKYPKVFGSAGVYSPSFWITPKLYEEVRTKGKLVNSKLYFFAGKLEDNHMGMVTDAVKMYETMRKVSKSKMKLVIKDDGRHNEATWRKDFPEFYKWGLN
jgi:predicted alpha/beta superfamily hydrolase